MPAVTVDNILPLPRVGEPVVTAMVDGGSGKRGKLQLIHLCL